MELLNGRDKLTDGRTPQELRVYDLLDSLGIFYQRIDHEPLYTMEACAGVDQVLQALICKNLFLCNKQRTMFYLLMLPGEKKFRTGEVSKKIGSTRLEFAPEEKMEEFLDLKPGSVTVMGLMNDHDNRVRLLVDKEILQEEFLGCHPCTNTSSLRIRVDDVFGRFLPAVNHRPILLELE